ncbi:(d)CMP kinase [Chondromyces apiculatus]|uniref:Cytidylate kinase n=1 Tax=Chondromyces apiculatus DSM 436 TaxID=1192034 RepID=A0A017T0A2_9BACT|nr:(d)CMP kinase [Chondromyces apiculatus]EYF01976.1 Cytidylate kinase [Chondromyces apiculatus DSM 436]
MSEHHEHHEHHGPDARRLRVAIDGPAGAGKGTVARGLSERLGYLLLDTGALYRTVALASARAGIAWEDVEAIGALARRLADEGRIALPGVSGAAARHVDHMQILLDGEDVSFAIRTPEMSLGASRVSAVPAVREALLAMQRQAGSEGGVVLEGRDIGTVVFPDAEVKFFLTAPAEIRARRRFDELAGRGVDVSFEETLADVIQRDKADSERAVAPLRQAADALVVDSAGRAPEAIVDEMARVVELRARAG